MTWAEAKAILYLLGGDDSASPYFLDEDDVEGWFNDAQRLMVNSARPIDKINNTVGVASQGEYTLPADLLKLWRVTYDKKRIGPVSRGKLRRYDANYEAHEGVPNSYYLDETVFMALYPVPSVADIELQEFYSAMATEVDNDNDGVEIDLPVWAIYGCMFGVLSFAYKTTHDVANPKIAAFWSALFQLTVERVKIRTNARLPKRWQKADDRRNEQTSAWVTRPETITE